VPQVGKSFSGALWTLARSFGFFVHAAGAANPRNVAASSYGLLRLSNGSDARHQRDGAASDNDASAT